MTSVAGAGRRLFPTYFYYRYHSPITFRAHLPFMIAEDQVGRVNPLIVQRYLLRVEFQFEDSSIQREAGE